MYDLKVVKKKKTKKVFAAIASMSAAGILILCAVALLGTQSGAFTVSLKEGSGRNFGLVENENDTDYQTYMTTGEVPQYDEFSYPNFTSKSYFESQEKMDAEIDNYATNDAYVLNEVNGEVKVIKYFKYTFFVVNYGSESVNYTATLNLKNASKASNGLDSILRVGFYENKVVDVENPEPGVDYQNHHCTFYARGASEYETVTVTNEDGTETEVNEYRERLCRNSDVFCESFENTNRLISSKVTDLQGGEKMRYTFLFWLEGTDPECTGKAPLNNHLKLSVSISVDE